jgi:hypothetical protein
MTAAKEREKAKSRACKKETSDDSKQKNARFQTSQEKLRHVSSSRTLSSAFPLVSFATQVPLSPVTQSPVFLLFRYGSVVGIWRLLSA